MSGLLELNLLIYIFRRVYRSPTFFKFQVSFVILYSKFLLCVIVNDALCFISFFDRVYFMLILLMKKLVDSCVCSGPFCLTRNSRGVLLVISGVFEAIKWLFLLPRFGMDYGGVDFELESNSRGIWKKILKMVF